MSSSNIKLPQQRLPKSRKGKAWRKQVLDSVDSNWGVTSNQGVRDSYRNKRRNQRLYEGILDNTDMKSFLNPYGISGLDISYDKVPNHNIIVPKVDLLVGEEANRDFDYMVIVTNPDAVSDKQNLKQKRINEEVARLLLTEEIPEEELKARLEDLQKYAKYSYKDSKELMANRLLKHYSIEQNFPKIFTEGFKDALIIGEELYECAVRDSEPILRKMNPHKVFTVRDNNSSQIEDSDIIIIEDYWSPGKILDTFYKELKPKDIDRINDGDNWTEEDGRYDPTISPLVLDGRSVDDNTSSFMVNDILYLAEQSGYDDVRSGYTDNSGNVRVLKVLWRSQKLIKKVKYYDDFGAVQYKIRSEEYVPIEALGEEEERLWINEWWEGTKIGTDIYVEMRPREVQYNRMDSPSLGHPGIVGEVYNTNEGRAISLVERMKGYQYLYNAVWDRINKALAKNLGKIMELDLAKVPADWSVDKWLYYATTMGLAVVDSFKEGNKGAATGKLAGANNTTGKVMDLETGQYIQQHIQLLEYIKNEMAELAGITKQREGQISNRETVGGVERSVMQSAHLTEWWFLKHEDVKKRAISVFLETAKQALKGTNKKIQYLLDDMSIEVLNVEGEEFVDADYGVVITSDKYSKQFRQSLLENSQAALQNQLIKYSDLFTIYSSSSLVEMRKTIEASEDKREAQAAQAEQNQAQQMQAQQELAMKAQEFAEFIETTKVAIEQSKVEIEKYKADIDAGVKAGELELKSQDIDAKLKAMEEDIELKEKELDEAIRHNKASEIIDNKKASQKPTTSTSKK